MQQTRSPEHDRGGADAAGIEALVKPRSLAVVGATADPSKVGGKLTRNVLGSLGASDGGVENVFLVNPNQRVVQGQETFASLGELPTVPDAVAVAVRADFALSAVRDAVELGSRAIVLVSSGFGEAG